MAGLRFQPRGVFADPAALGGDFVCQGKVFRRIDHIDPACHHRNRAGAALGQCGGMRFGVDAAREARDDGEPCRRQPLPQPPRHPHPEG